MPITRAFVEDAGLFGEDRELGHVSSLSALTQNGVASRVLARFLWQDGPAQCPLEKTNVAVS